MDRQANSQAGWALVTQGVTEARVQVHRLRHLLNRLISLSRDPRYSEILNRLLGDIISVAPDRVDELEVVLDRTGYALSMMGEEHLGGLVHDPTPVSRPMYAPAEVVSTRALGR